MSISASRMASSAGRGRRARRRSANRGHGDDEIVARIEAEPARYVRQPVRVLVEEIVRLRGELEAEIERLSGVNADLLAALKFLVRNFYPIGREANEAMRSARAAIARAEPAGEQPGEGCAMSGAAGWGACRSS
jgi:hypothetical protein